MDRSASVAVLSLTLTTQRLTQRESQWHTSARFVYLIGQQHKRQRRLMPSDPFYWSAKWRKTRALHLEANPVCCVVGCASLATHVDHRKARSRGGASFASHNLQSLCHSHHSVKTAQADGGFGNRRGVARLQVRGCGADGRPLDPLHSWNVSP